MQLNSWRNFWGIPQLSAIIADDNTIIGPTEIAEKLNNFFTSFTNYLSLTASEICTVSFFVSLDKFVLLHRRCLMSNFSEILILVCRLLSAFYLIWHETFSNCYGFPLMQEFNPFYTHLVL